MASPDNQVKIPTIDFCKQDVKPGTPQWETTKDQVFKAFQEYGCFEAIYDKIPNKIREDLFESLKQALPLKDKVKEYAAKPYHIYEGQYPHFPFANNNFHTADLLLPDSVETFANTFWPSDGNPSFCNAAKYFSKQLVELNEMVKMMVLESLGLNQYIDEFFEFSDLYELKLTRYFKEGNGATSHTDASFLTIIKQAQVGLQVQLENGEWIEPNVSPNSYIVLSGDSFKVWTNGRFYSPPHRVIMTSGDTERDSIQLFSTPRPGHIIETPKELVDEDHPLLFKPYDVEGYYKYFMSGAKHGLNLNDYILRL